MLAGPSGGRRGIGADPLRGGGRGGDPDSSASGLGSGNWINAQAGPCYTTDPGSFPLSLGGLTPEECGNQTSNKVQGWGE